MVGGNVKLTYAGITSFSAGFFLSFGFARSYYGAAAVPAHSSPPPAVKAESQDHVEQEAKAEAPHRTKTKTTREPSSVAPLRAALTPVRHKVAYELAAPQFTNPTDLKFSEKTGIFVRWTEVPHAEAYKVTISDGDGNKVREYKTKRSFTLLKSLSIPAGQTKFNIRVAAVDAAKTQGPQSEAKRLLMEIMQESAVDEKEEEASPAAVTSEPPPPIHATASAPEKTVPAKIELKPPSIKSISTED